MRQMTIILSEDKFPDEVLYLFQREISAAIRALGLAGFFYWQIYTRMGIPQTHIRQWAM